MRVRPDWNRKLVGRRGVLLRTMPRHKKKACAILFAESLANGSRRRYTCFASLDGKGRRGAIAAVPVQIAKGGIERTLDPALSPRERTVFENGFGYAS